MTNQVQHPEPTPALAPTEHQIAVYKERLRLYSVDVDRFREKVARASEALAQYQSKPDQKQ